MQIPVDILFRHAYKRFGIGAFNVFNVEQIQGVFRGAQLCGAPVILQTTPAALDYISTEVLGSIIKAVAATYPEVQYALHLDHGNYEYCMQAVQSGFYNSVMIDASHESFDRNIQTTKEIVQAAHARNIAVEAELGVLSGVEDSVSVDEQNAFYTDPKQAQEFVKRTGCDSLAIAAGTSHGAYKFSGGKGLQINILKEINKLLPGFPLVLHGASAVPANEVSRINKCGGNIKTEAAGLRDEQLSIAIQLGVCKINIATDMRLIWTRVHREFFNKTPELFDLVIPGKTYMNELALLVAQKCTLLNSNKKKIC